MDVVEGGRAAILHLATNFFAEESTAYATSLLGSYKFNKHFQIALSRTPRQGNAYTFFVQAEPFHAFVLGTVAGIISIDSEKLSQNAAPVGRMSITQINEPSERVQEMFEKSCAVLGNIMRDETTKVSLFYFLLPSIRRRESNLIFNLQDGCIARSWLTEGPSPQIFIDYGWSSDFTDGPIDFGSNVLVDVTLHRYDVYEDGVLAKVQNYSLVAHSIHVIDTEEMREAGFVNLASDLVPSVLQTALEGGGGRPKV
ncbi:hypothetical protein C8F04DRAFT_1198114 [Mycena alexandri]|uniref:Uncharacterized protein n=1 Tax=Mycena alexandri TaxID=1745969 RepID=A0AAD6WNA7_9AGAR|nr:hypothetical protein C8F04DRAFT_1198114 [Mycena alexandri]